MSWVYLIIAGFGEVGFVIFMKLSDNFKQLKYTLLCLASGCTSFFLLSIALKEIPVGTGYSIWTGIGAVGSVLVGMIFFNESRDWKRMFFISMIIISVVGLKIIAPH
jgi:quaternary ammonium compound-resistance protein SugE